MTRAPDGPTGERADAARNRARLLEVAARLVAERGAEHVTMHEVAEAAASEREPSFAGSATVTAS